MKQQKSKNSKAVEKASAPQKTKKTESTPLKYCKDQDGKVVVHVDSHESDNGLTFAEIAKKKFKEIVGVGDFELAESIINRSVRGLEVAHPDQKENITLQTLNNLKPKDVIEARLITQETLLYSEMMKALWFVSTAENAWEAELRLNLSTKLTRLHNETVETLSRYRRGGNQTVTVQHVIVDNRAVVNNYGVGGVNEKERGNLMFVKLCGARSKQASHRPCCQPAMANGKCRLHGGKSTGPRTEEGRQKIALANTKHGRYSRESIIQRKEMREFMKECKRNLVAL